MLEALIPEIEKKLQAQLLKLGKESSITNDEFDQVGILISPKFLVSTEGEVIGVELSYQGKFKGEDTREVSMLEVLEQQTD